jgi:hypothetical protein
MFERHGVKFGHVLQLFYGKAKRDLIHLGEKRKRLFLEIRKIAGIEKTPLRNYF